MQLVTRYFWMLFLCATLLAGEGYAVPPVNKEWLACEKDTDCTSVEVGCWHWQPVNRKYAEQMKSAGFVACKKSVPAGPQPASRCVAQVCVNAPQKHQ